MNVETIIIALVVSVLTPSITAIITNRARRADKKLDWDRQDEVARRAELAAKDLSNSNKNIMSGLKEIHTLVNSDMTAARMEQRDQTKLTLIGLRKIVQLDQDAGRKPSKEDLDSIDAAIIQIKNLDAILADRAAQQASVELQQRKAKDKRSPV